MKLTNLVMMVSLTLFGCTYPPAKAPAAEHPAEVTHTLVTTSSGDLAVVPALPVELLHPDVVIKPHIKALSLEEDRLIVFKGTVDDDSSAAFISKLIELEKADDKKPINIILRSGGGSISSGFRMIAAMDATKPQLVCIVDEGAYSMAAAIFLHCDKKLIQAHADMMFHEGSFGVSGDKRITEQRVIHVIRQMDALNEDVAKQLNISLEDYLAKVEYEWWLTAEDAVSAGAADQIVDGLKYPYTEPPPPPAFAFPF